MSTPAIKFLKQQGIDFKIIRYQCDIKGAQFAADATGYPLEQTIKTLVLDLGNKSYGLALMPGHRQLNLKRLAKAAGVKKADMTEPVVAERLTGYLVGGISPFGTRRPLPAIMETELTTHDHVVINGGRRGTMLHMRPEDIIDVLDCRVATIADTGSNS